MTLGEKLQELRKSKLMSQEKFAEVMNVSRQAVSKWELNQSYPEMDKLIEMSNYFNVSLDYLIKEQVNGVTSDLNIRSNDHLDAKKKTNNFDFLKIFMLITMAILMTAFRFFITGNIQIGFALVAFAIIISFGLYIAKFKRNTK